MTCAFVVHCNRQYDVALSACMHVAGCGAGHGKPRRDRIHMCAVWRCRPLLLSIPPLIFTVITGFISCDADHVFWWSLLADRQRAAVSSGGSVQCISRWRCQGMVWWCGGVPRGDELYVSSECSSVASAQEAARQQWAMNRVIAELLDHCNCAARGTNIIAGLKVHHCINAS